MTDMLEYTSASLTVSGSIITFDNMRVHQEMTDGVDTAEFTCLYSDYNDIINLGDTVSIWIARSGESQEQIFDGRIIRKELVEEGGPSKFLRIFCNELPEFFNRYISIGTSYNYTLKDAIGVIVEPLVDDGIITTIGVANMTSPCWIERIDNGEIHQSLKDLCNRYTIDFWLDLNKDLHAIHSSSLSTSPVTLDQTTDTDPRVLSMTFIEDLDRVRNTITIYGNCVGTLPNGSIDYWTDSTDGWSGARYHTDSGWIAITPTTAESLRTGDYCIKVAYSTGENIGTVQAIRASLDFQETIGFNIRGSLLVSMRVIDRHPVDYSKQGRRESGMFNIELRDSSNYYAYSKELYQSGSDIRDLVISIPDGFSYSYNFDWDELVGFKINVYHYYESGYMDIGEAMRDSELYIDRLYFKTLLKSSYADTNSVGSFGVRELPVDRKYYDVDNQSTLDAEAERLVSPYVNAEFSPRDVRCEGHRKFKKGVKIYLKTDTVEGTYAVKAVDFDIRELEWDNVLTLSSSRQFEPVMTRERMEKDKLARIDDLSKRVANLESKGFIRSLGDVDRGERTGGGIIESDSTIYWGDAKFDWQSISSLSTEWHSEFLDWLPSTFFPANVDGRSRFGEGFINADLILDGAVTEAKTSADFVLFDISRYKALGLYPCDEGEGSIVRDFSEFDHECTINYMCNLSLTNVTWADGKYNSGMTLDGSGYASCGNSLAVDVTVSPLAVFAWVKPDVGISSNGYIVAKNSVAAGDIQYGILYDYVNERITVYLEGLSRVAASASSVPKGSLTHVGFTWQDGTITPYVNGTVSGTPISYSATLTSRPYFNIGRRSSDYYFEGIIDEVKIYDRTLSTTEIENLRDNSDVIRGRRIQWRFDENTGSTAYQDQYCVGYTGAGLYFNGINAYASSGSFDSDDIIHGENKASWAFWIYYPGETKTDWQTFLYQDNKFDIYTRGTVHPNEIRMMIKSDGDILYSPIVTLSPNEWSHIVYVWDGIDNRIVAYQNGTLAANGTVPATQYHINSSTVPIQIGGTDFGDRFYGGLDEIRVYNRALTATQVKSQFRLGSIQQFADIITASMIAANAITADKIRANAVTTGKLNVVSHFLDDNITWSISGSNYEWTSGSLFYDGTGYSIASGSSPTVSTKKYIYWNYGENSFSASTIYPSLDVLEGDALIAIGISNTTIRPSWNATAIHGGQLVTESITADEIAAKSILAKHINVQTHYLDGITFSTHGGDTIKWTAGTIYYEGDPQAISAGTTNSKYTWWNAVESSFRTTDDFPPINYYGGDALVAYNDSGVAFIMIQPTMIHGGFLKTFSIDADRIGAHVITADKLKIQSHYLYNATFSNNDPSAGYISWDKEDAGESIVLTYKAVSYTIPASNTDSTFTWWNYGDSSFSTANSVDLGFHDCLIAYNDNGTVIPSFMASMLHGGAIVTDSITAIQLAAGCIDTDHLNADIIESQHIKTGQITSTLLDFNQVANQSAEDSLVAGMDGGEMWWRIDNNQLKFYDGATTYYFAKFPISADDLIIWSSAQITAMLTDWATFYAGIGPVALTAAGIIATGAIDTIGQIVDNFFSGASGLAKFATGLFTSDSDGRGKFGNLFVNEALIDTLAVTEAKIDTLAVTTAKIADLAVEEAKIGNLAVTTGKIGSLAVTEAKIGSLAVTTGKIDSLAVTEAKIADAAISSLKVLDANITTAKIADAAITNIKIGSGEIAFDKADSTFSWGSWGNNQKITCSYEAITGFTTAYDGEGSWSVRKNQLRLMSGTVLDGYAWIYGYRIIDPTFDPWMKTRMRFWGADTGITWSIGCGSWEDGESFMGYGSGITPANEVYYWNIQHTVSSNVDYRMGMYDTSSGETYYGVTRESANSVWVYLWVLGTSGASTLSFETSKIAIPTTRSRVTITHSAPAVTLNHGDAMLVTVMLRTGAGQEFSSSSMNACTIPSSTWEFRINCWDSIGDGLLYFYFGNTSTGGLSEQLIQTPMVMARSEDASRTIVSYISIADTLNHIYEARWDDSSDQLTFYYDETEIQTEYQLDFSGTFAECAYYLKNAKPGSRYTMEITNYSVQEGWQ